MKKLVLATAITLASTGASAANVEWDLNIDGDNYTSAVPVLEFVFQYNSQSIVTDSDGSGDISVGDAITSHGGFGPNGFDSLAGSPIPAGLFSTISDNGLTGFDPDIPAPGDYKTEYTFTFYFNDLMGEWDGNDFRYNSGEIQFGYYDLTNSAFNNLFAIDILDGGNIGGAGQASQIFEGEINEASLENGAGAGFMLTQNGKTRTLSDWLAGDLRVLFTSGQTVKGGLDQGLPSNGADIDFGGSDTAYIAANHDGSFVLNVPEPSSIAVLGLSLIGFGAAARRRKA
ncbi:PEP-CTERM sorting domain-containing protein [Alteromonas halophila]|nr:PEP-CTERM sorting domain-containing protein [Alteromonas halophila]